MKYSNIGGGSFSEIEDVKTAGTKQLGRGLLQKTKQILAPAEYKGNDQIRPSNLVDYVGKHHAMALRQTISILDKIIRKPARLRDFELQAYKDRALLAHELWLLLCEQREQDIRKQNGDEAFEVFQANWRWKVHPYTDDDGNIEDFSRDQNAKYLFENKASTKERSEFEGRWHNALWKGTEAEPNYSKTADAIFSHLWKQEITIYGESKKKINDGNPEPTKIGYIEARGLYTVSSVNDPRKGKKHTPANCSVAEVKIYFKKDIVEEIAKYVHKTMEAEGFLSKLEFGDLLYKHFGDLPTRNSKDKNQKERIWALHNKVRQFYAALRKSDRFRIAFRTGNKSELDKVLPQNRKQLLSIISAKNKNSEISELIRLGKLIAHASELPENADINSAFDERLDYLVTSDGQSEIKRNETFTRVWRNSVGLSQRTLRVLVDPNNENNLDLTTGPVSVQAALNCDLFHFREHLKFTFGQKYWTASGEAEQKNRHNILVTDNDQNQREIVWGLLRLSAELRNGVNHFNTKSRLIALLKKGIVELEPEEGGKAIGSRKPRYIRDPAAEAFEKLLKFDQSIVAKVTADDLNRLKVGEFVKDETALKTVLGECIGVSEKLDFNLPRFSSVIKYTQSLAKNPDIDAPDIVKPLLEIPIGEKRQTATELDKCKTGVFQQAYATGFRNWLKKDFGDENPINAILGIVSKSKAERSHKYNEGQQTHSFRLTSYLDDLGITPTRDLEQLFKDMASHSVRAERLNQSYKANQSRQLAISNKIEKFKQEFIGLLFGVYVQNIGLDKILGKQPTVSLSEKDVEEVAAGLGKSNRTMDKNWHSQFYTWLYLVPSDDISLLRHQLQKTLVLDDKSASENDTDVQETLTDLDYLMALYTRVQSAGFDGKEHDPDHATSNIYFENNKDFKKVFNEDKENPHPSYPGMHRGIRQLKRFGHDNVLQKIFEKHLVTNGEVSTLIKMRTDDLSDTFALKNKTRKDIEDIVNADKQDDLKADLKRHCEKYRQSACDTALYNFSANAARLNEHARLHQLLMRIVGRLMDYTLIWERDRSFLFLGMLYRQLEGKLEIVVSERKTIFDPHKSREIEMPRRIGIKINDEYYKNKLKSEGEQIRDSSNKDDLLFLDNLEQGFLPLWNEETGIDLPDANYLCKLLEESNLSRFERHFVKADRPNRKDIAANNRKKKAHPSGDVLVHESHYGKGKQQIRNDFAHYNILTNKNGPMNLNYLINAVRSLMSYDRKLKNAVTQSMKKILLQNNIEIRWELREDRLQNAVVTPTLEQHLGMIRGEMGKSVRFRLPQASVRFTSMVKALFEFDARGHRDLISTPKGKKKAGKLGYPYECSEITQPQIPIKMFIELPKLGSDNE